LYAFLGTAPSPEQLHSEAQDQQQVRRVLAALARLSDTDAEVLRLDAWEQLSAVSIAAVLGIEPNAARRR
jgi:DNA-directed RNA polymerase specialized sigma24 family protein